jgi:hypothetical protein
MAESSEAPLRYPADTARDLGGRECTVQPKGNELPVLDPAAQDIGCGYKDYSSPSIAAPGGIDVIKLYRENRPSIVHFKLENKDGVNLGGGTAFMAKATDDSCRLVTDNHVVSKETMEKFGVVKIEAVTADGRIWPVEPYRSKPEKDMASVSIHTGKDTASLCKPLEVEDGPIAVGESAVTIGTPFATGAIYVADGVKRGEIGRGDAVKNLRAEKLPPGDDPNRKVDIFLMRATPGFSGGAMFDKSGKVKELVDMADGMTTTLGTPITRADVKDLTD